MRAAPIQKNPTTCCTNVRASHPPFSGVLRASVSKLFSDPERTRRVAHRTAAPPPSVLRPLRSCRSAISNERGAERTSRSQKNQVVRSRA